jgi:hypothetical protein
MSAQPDTDTRPGSIVAVGLIGSILLVVVVVALEALFVLPSRSEAEGRGSRATSSATTPPSSSRS